MKLYEIVDSYRELLESIASGDIPPEAADDTLEAVEMELSQKIENVAFVVKEKEADIDAIDKEITRLTALKQPIVSEITRLKAYAKSNMERAKIRNIKTARISVFMKTNAPSTIIEDEDKFIKWARKNAPHLITEQSPKIDKKAVKEMHEINAVPFVSLESTESLVIKK